jgi:hypothetical protein
MTKLFVFVIGINKILFNNINMIIWMIILIYKKYKYFNFNQTKKFKNAQNY